MLLREHSSASFPRPGIVQGFVEQPVLVGSDDLEIGRICGKARRGLDLALAQQAVTVQQVRTDQQRVAGERGKAVVGRVSRLCRRMIQRQKLPVVLARRLEEIGEFVRIGTQIADAVPGRKDVTCNRMPLDRRSSISRSLTSDFQSSMESPGPGSVRDGRSARPIGRFHRRSRPSASSLVLPWQP
jgi:hypothetical protein